MTQRYLVIRYECPVDPEQPVTWPHEHSRQAYLDSQTELDPTDLMNQARLSVVNTLNDNGGSTTAGDCWKAYLAQVRGENLQHNVTHAHTVAFNAAIVTVMFAAKFNTNHQPPKQLALKDAVGYSDFRDRYMGQPIPDKWDARLEHTIARNLIALLEIHGFITRHDAFRVIIEAVDEIATTGGLHIQRTTRRVLDELITELFPKAFAQP